MMRCPFCDAVPRLTKGPVWRFGVEVEGEYYACTSCGEEFLTLDQVEAAERPALAVLEGCERAAAARARRRPAGRSPA